MLINYCGINKTLPLASFKIITDLEIIVNIPEMAWDLRFSYCVQGKCSRRRLLDTWVVSIWSADAPWWSSCFVLLSCMNWNWTPNGVNKVRCRTVTAEESGTDRQQFFSCHCTNSELSRHHLAFSSNWYRRDK